MVQLSAREFFDQRAEYGVEAKGEFTSGEILVCGQPDSAISLQGRTGARREESETEGRAPVGGSSALTKRKPRKSAILSSETGPHSKGRGLNRANCSIRSPRHALSCSKL